MKKLAEPPGLSCISSGHLSIRFETSEGISGSWCIWCSTGAYGWSREDEIADELLYGAHLTELTPHGSWHGRDD